LNGKCFIQQAVDENQGVTDTVRIVPKNTKRTDSILIYDSLFFTQLYYTVFRGPHGLTLDELAYINNFAMDEFFGDSKKRFNASTSFLLSYLQRKDHLPTCLPALGLERNTIICYLPAGGQGVGEPVQS
jgi:hypothetical protein